MNKKEEGKNRCLIIKGEVCMKCDYFEQNSKPGDDTCECYNHSVLLAFFFAGWERAHDCPLQGSNQASGTGVTAPALLHDM